MCNTSVQWAIVCSLDVWLESYAAAADSLWMWEGSDTICISMGFTHEKRSKTFKGIASDLNFRLRIEILDEKSWVYNNLVWVDGRC